MITVRFIDNAGGGYAEDINVQDGTTVGQIFAEQKGTATDPQKFSIRLNNELCRASDVLHEGDTISITPVDLKAF